MDFALPTLPRSDAQRQAPVDVSDLRHFYRWGWLPLVLGSALIAAATLATWEAVLLAVASAAPSALERWLYWGRAVSVATLLAGYTGWYVLASRRRIEAARERLRLRESDLAERQRRMEQTEGLHALTRILAHEIRNPLNSMSLQCLLLRRAAQRVPGGCAEEAQRITGLLESEIHRLDRLVESYLHGNGPVTLDRVPVDLAALVREAIEVERPAFDDQGVELRVDAPADLPRVPADAGKIEQLVHNLLRNALEAVGERGRVRVALVAEAKCVAVTFTDDGPGFDAPEKVFRPFYTTKRNGTGLGLAVVQDIVRAHAGSVSADNVGVGAGARVVVRLPLEREP